jgi:hypothetical protein
MNAIQPAAHARAVTGFANSKAGAGSIVSCAWNRSLLWLLVRFLPVVILSCLSITPAHADGVSGTISNGETKSGTVTETGVDSYSFTIPKDGGSFVVSVGETGVHDPHFVPMIDLVKPGGIDKRGMARSLQERLEETKAAAGPWTVKISRLGGNGTSGGAYALTLIQVPGATGTDISSGAVFHGSNVRGQVDVWTFSGVAGHTKTMSLNAAGGTGFIPEVHVFAPSGAFAIGVSCGRNCEQDLPVTETGKYTVMAWKYDSNDVTGAYALSVNDKK